MSLLRTINILSNSLVIAIPVWVFFLQSPLLVQFMGRDRFIPPMMRITKLMFHWTLPIAATVAAISSYLLGNTDIINSIEFISSAISLLSVLINSIIVVPHALDAGKRSTRTADKSKSVTKFAVDGASKSDTKTLHQTVVLFVVIMLAASITHVHVMVNN
jgi:hypothetical protein